MPDVHRLLEEQTGWLKRGAFHPVPCSHPSCYTATYLLDIGDGDWTKIPSFRLNDAIRSISEKAGESHEQ